jgi:CheY-like chemotaxis protein
MSKRILVVEDQPDNRQIIRDMLAPTDYEITEAEDGEHALAAVAKQRPHLILMGIQLPIMDDYEVTRRIKARFRVAIDSDHRHHLLRARWGRTNSAGGGM